MSGCTHGPNYDGCKITILATGVAVDHNMPCHLFIGHSSDGARFQVTAGPTPHNSYDMAALLEHTLIDSTLDEYDHDTGIGYFYVIDSGVPGVGKVITLINPFSCPECELTTASSNCSFAPIGP